MPPLEVMMIPIYFANSNNNNNVRRDVGRSLPV